MQEFSIASQQQEESVSEWALRLEEIIKHAIDKGQIKEDEKNDLLKDKFWRSLRSERLKNATRLDFRTIENFKQLVHAVRTEELSMKTNANAQHQAVSTNVTTRQDKQDEMDSSKQEEMYHTLVDLRRELKQYNKQKAQEKQWYRKKGRQQMNQQQGFQQQGFQQQGNQQQRNQNQQQDFQQWNQQPRNQNQQQELQQGNQQPRNENQQSGTQRSQRPQGTSNQGTQQQQRQGQQNTQRSGGPKKLNR